ncbi:MAG: hypothetical protein ACREKH_14045 [Candidatus Rokuibacteriota bacterium]
MSKRTSLLAALGALALLAGVLQTAPVLAADEEMATLSGCLNPGDEEGSYVLTPDEGEPVHVTGGDDLKAHSGNHQVKLTGEWVDMEGHKMFKASKVEHVGVCE